MCKLTVKVFTDRLKVNELCVVFSNCFVWLHGNAPKTCCLAPPGRSRPWKIIVVNCRDPCLTALNQLSLFLNQPKPHTFHGNFPTLHLLYHMYLLIRDFFCSKAINKILCLRSYRDLLKSLFPLISLYWWMFSFSYILNINLVGEGGQMVHDMVRPKSDQRSLKDL